MAAVGAQVAFAVTLLVGAGLLLRSLEELGRVLPGFDASHVVTLQISGGWAETADMKRLTQRIDGDLDALRAVPGVEAAATSGWLPAALGSPTATFMRSTGNTVRAFRTGACSKISVALSDAIVRQLRHA